LTSRDLIVLLAVWLATRPRMGVFGSGWSWPVPDIDAGGVRVPAIVSSGWTSKHPALDIMFHNAQEGYFAPEGVPVRAARAGKVWSTLLGRRGWSVVVDHGGGWKTWYQHLANVQVVPGQVVEAGEDLGKMGIDPLDQQQVRHLHFAVWQGGVGDGSSVDPTSGMQTWARSLWTP